MPKPNIVSRSLFGTHEAVLIASSGRKLPTPPRHGTVLFDANGLPCRIEWSTPEDGVKITKNFDFLGKVPGLAKGVADAVAKLFNTDSSEASVESLASDLRVGLFAYFCDEERRNLRAAQIEHHHIDGLITFLRSNKTTLVVKRRRYYHAIRALKSLDGFSAEAPANPFRGKVSNPSIVLETSVIYAALRAAADDILMRKDRMDAITAPKQ